VVAILRNKKLMANPKSMTVFEVCDRIGLIGESEQIKAAGRLLAMPGLEETPIAPERGEDQALMP